MSWTGTVRFQAYRRVGESEPGLSSMMLVHYITIRISGFVMSQWCNLLCRVSVGLFWLFTRIVSGSHQGNISKYKSTCHWSKTPFLYLYSKISEKEKCPFFSLSSLLTCAHAANLNQHQGKRQKRFRKS